MVEKAANLLNCKIPMFKPALFFLYKIFALFQQNVLLKLILQSKHFPKVHKVHLHCQLNCQVPMECFAAWYSFLNAVLK